MVLKKISKPRTEHFATGKISIHKISIPPWGGGGSNGERPREKVLQGFFLTRLYRAREKSRSDSHVGLPRAYSTEFPLQGKGDRVSATRKEKAGFPLQGKGDRVEIQGFRYRERGAGYPLQGKGDRVSAAGNERRGFCHRE